MYESLCREEFGELVADVRNQTHPARLSLHRFSRGKFTEVQALVIVEKALRRIDEILDEAGQEILRMKGIEVTPYQIAERFVGIKEVKGLVDNPHIMAMLQLDDSWPQHDEVPWCSAFVNYVCWLLGLSRSRSLRARSWLEVGKAIYEPSDVEVGFDVVVMKRNLTDPGSEVIDALGHVGFFGGWWDLHKQTVRILGGNQSDSVSVQLYPSNLILGVRRLWLA